jgi:CRISPR-associated protein Cas4
MTVEPDYLRINEIKNYLYCARISYYTLCLMLDRETDLSKGGIREEQEAKKAMKRRKHALHAVHDGTRQFDVDVVHHDLRYVGKVDEMVTTSDGVYLIDYKDTDRDYGYWQVQMLGYQLAAQAMGYTVLGCYVYIIPKKDYKSVTFKPKHQQQLTEILSALREMVETERMPESTSNMGKCLSCQYARLCNDVF